MSGDRTALSKGATIGERYRVERPLGEGGMGSVYEAENTITGRRVAIKVLSAARASPQVRRRLLREARVAARVQHPHVIDIYDVGFDGDEMFLVMELLRGQPLDRWIAEHAPAEPAAILPYAQQLLRGLGALHAAGVVHRDLKPANVFIVHTEHSAPRAKLLDLGIARDRGSDSGTYTKPDQIIGTPAYMAPEQLERPDEVDPRADIHALGVVLYEALAGQRPYRAEDLTALAVTILASKRAPLRELRPGLPEGLCEVVERALSADPEDRYPDAASFAEALAPFGPEEAYVPLPPPAPERTATWPALVAVVAIGGLIGAGAWMLRGEDEPPPTPPVASGPAAVDAGPPEPSEPPAPPPDAGPPQGLDPPTDAGPPPHVEPASLRPTRRRRRRAPTTEPRPSDPPASTEPGAPHLRLDPDDF